MNPFSVFEITPQPIQGRNEEGQGGTFPQASNHCRRRRKIPQCHKYFLQYSTFASERPQESQVRAWERQTCFLSRAPSG